MLDLIDRSETDVDTTAVSLTETQARAELGRFAQPGARRPTIRALAKDWGWSPATTGRFVQKFDAETAAGAGETRAETSETPEPTPNQRRTMLIEGAKDFDAKY